MTADCFLLYDAGVAHRGKFITFEGLDGCGKSTQLEKLAVVLRGQGLQVVVTREPGGTPVGEKIRQLLLDTGTSGLAPLAELALMFASRAQHIKDVIHPAMAEGRIVLCDRFTDSTEAYQGGGRKLSSEPVLALHRILCGDLQPELTILMDSDVALSVERARRRNQGNKPRRRKPLRTGEPRVFWACPQYLYGHRRTRAEPRGGSGRARNSGRNPSEDRRDCPAAAEAGGENSMRARTKHSALSIQSHTFD